MNRVVLLVLLLSAYARAYAFAKFDDENALEKAEKIAVDESTTAELVDLICSLKEDDDAYLRKPVDCYDIMRHGQTESGRYFIYPHDDGTPQKPLFVWCDMVTDGGGWTVLQKRQDGSVDFDREWEDYKNGFGEIGGEYWLGNEHTHVITNQKEYALRVEADEYDGTKHIATSDHFRLGAENTHYTLFTGTFSGKQDVCDAPMGMESGHITDAMIAAASEDPHAELKADFARLKNTKGSWSPKTNTASQYIQVYFVNAKLVSGIVMQGRHNSPNWVSKFRVYYHNNIAWQYILDSEGKIMEFDGNVNQNSYKIVYFKYPIRVHYIRIYPLEWKINIGLRFELLGCDGNFLAYLNNQKFSTKDADNDDVGNSNCAGIRGAWWYGERCHRSDLNHVYLEGAGNTNRGVSWYNFATRVMYPLKRTEMKIRPVSFNGDK